jgi:hypothetical protein
MQAQPDHVVGQNLQAQHAIAAAQIDGLAALLPGHDVTQGLQVGGGVAPLEHGRNDTRERPGPGWLSWAISLVEPLADRIAQAAQQALPT